MNYNIFKLLSLATSFILLINTETFAQSGTLQGQIYELHTHIGVSGIKVEDLKTNAVTSSDATGRFNIRTTVGDLICFSSSSYKPDTILVTSLRSMIEIYLELRQNQLNEVKVNGSNADINIGSMATPVAAPFGSNTVRYQTDGSGNDKGGVGFSLLGGADPMQVQRKKEAQLATDEETQRKIDKDFSPASLSALIPLKDQEMTNFIKAYRPTVNVYHSNFNLQLYVNTCYKDFMKLPPETRQSKDFMELYKKTGN